MPTGRIGRWCVPRGQAGTQWFCPSLEGGLAVCPLEQASAETQQGRPGRAAQILVAVAAADQVHAHLRGKDLG